MMMCLPLPLVHAILIDYAGQWVLRGGALVHINSLSPRQRKRCGAMLKRHHAHQKKTARHLYESNWAAVMVPPFYSEPLDRFMDEPPRSSHAAMMQQHLVGREHLQRHPGFARFVPLPKRVIGYYRIARQTSSFGQFMTKIGFRVVCANTVLFQMEWVLSYANEPVEEVWPLAYLPIRRRLP